jgi:riboflavin synthase
MFTGIVETLGEVTKIQKEGTNIHFTIKSAFTDDLKIDESVSHNGVCLTVVAINNNEYTVTAIKETLDKTNLGDLKIGDKVNLERAMSANGRFDGHIVQGHVDTVAKCIDVKEENGSWIFTFELPQPTNQMVEKGSITVNGISLTLVNVSEKRFSVAIIPYTFEHTNLQYVKPGYNVNIEFDVIGKYVAKMLSGYIA